LATQISRTNACRRLSFGHIEEQSVQKYIPHNRTTQRRYTPRDSSRQSRNFGKSIPEFGETHSNVLGCEMRRVSAFITSRSCFASFPVCVYKFSSHYLINKIFINNSLRPLATGSHCSCENAYACEFQMILPALEPVNVSILSARPVLNVPSTHIRSSSTPQPSLCTVTISCLPEKTEKKC
jgi:hypothetical protein